ncbi:MAG: HAD-IA family hydrolase [Vicinamibacterales bacterium]
MGDLHRLIAFDLDGTLIDSRRDLTDSANQLIVELGGAPLSEEAVGRMVGEGARLLVQRALTAAGLGDPSGSLERFLSIYDDRLLVHTRMYDGVPAALEAASRVASLSLLTNKPLAPTMRILDALGIASFFGSIIGGDSAFPRKPDPASLLDQMRLAGVDSRGTLLVGDSAIDRETARRAGVRCCLVRYGFGRVTLPDDVGAGDGWIVDDAGELPDVFRQFADVG